MKLYLQKRMDVSDLPLPVDHAEVSVIIVQRHESAFVYGSKKKARDSFQRQMKRLRQRYRQEGLGLRCASFPVRIRKRRFYEISMQERGAEVPDMLLFASKTVRDKHYAWLTKRST